MKQYNEIIMNHKSRREIYVEGRVKWLRCSLWSYSMKAQFLITQRYLFMTDDYFIAHILSKIIFNIYLRGPSCSETHILSFLFDNWKWIWMDSATISNKQK